jgi:hypothetical protein
MKTRPPTPVRVATTTAYPTAGKGASAERHIFSAPYTPCMNFRAPLQEGFENATQRGFGRKFASDPAGYLHAFGMRL